MDIKEILNSRRLILDGGMGTELQAAGLPSGVLPETWNLTHPEIIGSIHRSYLEAGADIISTNTFGANRFKYPDISGDFSLHSIIESAVRIADGERIKRGGEKFIALDIGPTGRLIEPFGDMKFEEAVDVFTEIIKIGCENNVDLMFFETFGDSYEAKAALIAARETTDLPVFISFAFDSSCRLMNGSDAAAVSVMAQGLGASAVGANCGVGPDLIKPVADEFMHFNSVPVIMKPNAGLPHNADGKTMFDVDPLSFGRDMAALASSGVSLLGGCCGTTPEHIKALADAVRNIPFTPITKKNITAVTSYSHAVVLGEKPVLIGERINPTGKKVFKEALRKHDIAYILNQGAKQQKSGAHILDVNVGLPEIDEKEMMRSVVESLQSVIDLPLQIDTTDHATLEAALRIYNGKPLINSVNGKKESMDSVFPLAKKYGGVLVGLTLDESGIPDTATGRADIAGKIIDAAEKYGIDKNDIIIDPLTMAVATDKNAANVTLESVRLIKERYGVSTCLGVSNVSFGLPDRDRINSAFFTLALGAGLSAAIMNPLSEKMTDAYKNYLALSGYDEACTGYIEYSTGKADTKSTPDMKSISLTDAIISGMKEMAAALTAEELKTKSTMEIIDGIIVPSLGVVGDGFADKTVFLPQLLMSAEAAKAAFDVIRSSMPPSQKEEKKAKIILATVKGDIHDIGKNIVRALLENYNYNVIDLGRNVEPDLICETAKIEEVALVGLSALMTTTVPSMDETIKQLRHILPGTKVMVGGAVLTQEYADMIGADHYSPDAMDAVRYAEKLFGHSS